MINDVINETEIGKTYEIQRDKLKYDAIGVFIDDLRYYIESIVLPYKPKVQVMIYDWYNNYNINDMVK